jgi:hypothetical protein
MDGPREPGSAARLFLCSSVAVLQLRPLRRYNTLVPATQPDHNASGKRHRHAMYATETAGLLLIAFLLLVLTVVRYWHDIHWSIH